ncbi:unnamed protein product [Clonostachys rosea]|uniref:NACHT domain-containing protein n=1 Tax=Bionectria ochroleuca TaxID=29856 RepID=A0ABY6UJV5_BIOOC|nr:unnamed protein product [Clonostachys rosea]
MTIGFIEAKQWRGRLANEADRLERQRAAQERLAVFSWLGLSDTSQEDRLDRLLRDSVPGTCDSFGKHELVRRWEQDDTSCRSLWVHGKPGAGPRTKAENPGKSTLCANFLELLRNQKIATFWYLCSYQDRPNALNILRVLASQIIASNPSFVGDIYDRYVIRIQKPNSKALRSLIQELIDIIQSCRIVIDGLDECVEMEQKYILEDLFSFVKGPSKTTKAKLLLFSRDIPSISSKMSRSLKGLVKISLSSELTSSNNNITYYVNHEVQNIGEKFTSLNLKQDLDNISHLLIERSEGMFLWVKLIMHSLLEADSIAELQKVIVSMPRELPEVYDRILDQMYRGKEEAQREKVLRMLKWIVFSYRPLKHHELLHGVAVTVDTPDFCENTRLQEHAMDICKPLVEKMPDGTVTFIHHTIQEYVYIINKCPSLY